MKRTSLTLLTLCALASAPIMSARPAQAQTVNCTGIAAWSGNSVAYAVGALVTYQGSEYKVIQAHTSLPTWDPVDAASLFTKLGTCATTTGTTTGATCAAAPGAPTGLAASGTTSTSTNLSWTAVTPPANCTVSSYTVYKAGVSIGTATGTTFAVTGLTALTTYAFTVAATDAFGTGTKSTALNVTTSAASSCAASPSAPTGLAASGTTSTSTNLSWTAVTPPANCSISSYTIFKSGTSIGTSTTTSFAVTGLTASTSYSFTVAATDAHGASAQSTALGVTTTAGGTLPACFAAWNSTQSYSAGAQVSESGINYTAAFFSQGSDPATNNGATGSGQPWVSNGACNNGQNCTVVAPVPTGLAAANTSSSTTSLSWSAVTPPTNCLVSSYTVYENGTALATVSSGTSYIVSGLTASTKYTFTVASTDKAGTSAQSASVSVTTAAQGSTSSSKMIGYWESWGSTTLATVATNYDVVEVAFAVSSGTDGATIQMPQMTESAAQVQADIATLHSQGKKVVLSIGGANTFTFKVQSAADESAFVSSIEGIFSQFAFDGIDLDIENNLLNLNAGDNDINNPTTPSTVFLIQGLQALQTHFGSAFVYTMAPQTSDIDAMGHWGTVSGIGWGDFIPLINKTRGILTYCMTQDYNSGQEYGLDMAVYTEGTVDFNVAMSDLLLHGYAVDNPALQAFPALGQSQVVMGVPAVTAAAGSGYLAPASVLAAFKYLARGTADGGSYTLKGGPYPNMGGVMTWDCNYDLNAGYPMAGALVSYLHSH